MIVWSPLLIAAFVCALLPLLAFGLVGKWIAATLNRLPIAARLFLPAVLGIPYALASLNASTLRWGWLAVYLLLPVAVAAVFADAARRDPQQQGNWRDFAILILLGCAVDLRWFDSAWPPHLAMISKLILLDAGLYGFLAVRQLTDIGYDLRLRAEDLGIGLREMVFFAPIAVPLGLALDFLHWHAHLPRPGTAALTWLFTFFFIAIPEEIFFRGWMQNLLERRLGKTVSLLLTAAIFGLAHFNRRGVTFNWRYVLLAAIAGIFYGRAWRSRRRIAASAITHASVDAIWSLWLL